MSTITVNPENGTIEEVVIVRELTLIRWINLWNQGCIDALFPKSKTGRPLKLSPDTHKRIVRLMNDPQSAGQTHWTGGEALGIF